MLPTPRQIAIACGAASWKALFCKWKARFSARLFTPDS